MTFRIALRRGISCLLIPAACLLFACGKDTGEGKAFAYPIDEAPHRLDPAVADSAEELLIINNCFEGLVRQDAEGSILPGMAKVWEVSPDGLTYIFTLWEDARWHLQRNMDGSLRKEIKELLGEQADGFDTRVTAQDFVFGITRAMLPETNSPGAGALDCIRSVAAQGDDTLQIILERPDAHFLHTLTQSAAMPCKQSWFEATRGRYGLTAIHLLCNGPFYLYRWDDTVLRLRKNPGYSGPSEAMPASVSLYVQPDPSARVNSLGAEGGYDAAVVPASYGMELPAGAAGSTLDNATLAFIFRCDSEPLDDVSLRVALCAALHPDELGIAPFSGLLPACVRIGGESLNSLAPPPTPLEHDPERAAGAERIDLALLCLPEHELLCRRAVQQWQRQFGIALTVRVESASDPEEYASRLRKGEYDIAVALLRAQNSFAPQVLEDWAAPGGPLRYTGEKLDALLRAARAQNAPETARACRAAEEHLMHNGVVYPIAPQASLLVIRAGNEGFAMSPAGDMIFFGNMKKFE